MKKYTQADFDALVRDEEGYLHIPSGDWTGVNFGGQIKMIFGDGCKLGSWCKLGNGCKLGSWCKLGNGCKLGSWCKLGDGCKLGNECELGSWCELGNWCKLGDGCKLGSWCKLGDKCELGNECELGNRCTLGNGCELGNRCTLGSWCELGNGCKLGSWCTLGDECELGNECKLGNRCKLESGHVQNAAFFFASNIGSENRTAYAYCNTKTGEIFVRAGCWFSDLPAFIERVKSVHGGTQHETDYLAFAEFAKARFAQYLPKEESADE